MYLLSWFLGFYLKTSFGHLENKHLNYFIAHWKQWWQATTWLCHLLRRTSKGNYQPPLLHSENKFSRWGLGSYLKHQYLFPQMSLKLTGRFSADLDCWSPGVKNKIPLAVYVWQSALHALKPLRERSSRNQRDLGEPLPRQCLTRLWYVTARELSFQQYCWILYVNRVSAPGPLVQLSQSFRSRDL